MQRHSKAIYGYRKVYEDFKIEVPELSCSRETLRKVMHENRLFACIKRHHRYPKLDRSNIFEFPKNKLNRNFKTLVKNLKWTGDITYIRTIAGWIYLTVVTDLYSRKIVGWSVSRNIDSKLVCDALNNAIIQRSQSGYLLFHSDRGSQYSSDEFQDLLLSRGIESSMSLSGDPWSNAVQENFFQKLKHEFIRGRKFANFEDVRKELFWYIELFYNMRRRQKDLGYISPAEYEKTHEVVA